MNPQSQKVKVFVRSAFILSALGTLLYTLSHWLATDGSGYFVQGHPLPLLANILSAVCVLWFLCACILIPKGVLPAGDFMINTHKPFTVAVAPIVGTLVAGAVSFIYYAPYDLIGFIIQQIQLMLQDQAVSSLLPTAICVLLTTVAALMSAVYFLLRMLGCDNLRALITGLGFGPILLLTGLCGVTYFDQTTYMNSPVKIAFQLAWIAMLLFMTAELRFTIDAAQPRRYLACACIALYANGAASIPHLVYLFKNQPVSYADLAYAVLCLGSCIYLICRMIQFSKFCCASADDTQVAPEQIPGKDA